MEGLRECPCCGSEDVIPGVRNEIVTTRLGTKTFEFTYPRRLVEIECANCGCSMSEPVTEGDEAAGLILYKRWNTRASGWISVDERLPERTGYFLVSYNGADQIRFVAGDVYKSGKNLGVEGFATFKRSVTHWQPLPEPPK